MIQKKGKDYSYLNIEIRPFKVLVEVDSTANNNWAIYEWVPSTKLWNRTNTQTFDLARFWSYKDYIVDGFDKDEIINYKIKATFELDKINPSTGYS